MNSNSGESSAVAGTGKARYTAHVVPHTHWDREWYRSFSWFRGRLVDVIDKVTDLLEGDTEYKGFTLDGQTILLEDYLELRPERRDRIKELVQSGRLSVGPWYVLADEFLVSPESLIRNLMVGLRMSSEFGGALHVAYTPDSFGHISQLPLIVAGFGLDSIIFERGVGDEGEDLGAEFVWVSADDKARVFSVHLLATYSAAAAAGHGNWEFLDEYSSNRAVQHVRAALNGVSDSDLSYMPDFIRESLERVQGGLIAYSNSSSLLLLNGSDHLFPQPNVPEFVDDVNSAFSEVEFLQSDLEKFIRNARSTCGPLKEYRGELRGSRYQHVLSGVLSSRLYLKQANQRVEYRLARVSEPLAVMAWILQYVQYPKPLLDNAWMTLLKNHPHDSICGCSIDSVHRDMMGRFSAVEHLLDYLDGRAIDALSGSSRAIDHIPGGLEYYLLVFNPYPEWTNSVVHSELTLPPGNGATFALVDENDEHVPFWARIRKEAEAGTHGSFVDSVSIGLCTALKPLGITTLRVSLDAYRGKGPSERQVETFISREVSLDSPKNGKVTASARQRNGSLVLRNDRIRLTIGSAGEIEILDLNTNQVLTPTVYFEDMGDAGDEYDFSPVSGETPIVLRNPVAPPELVLDSTVEAVAGLEYAADIPERLSDDRSARIGVTRLSIRLELAVLAGSSSVGIRVSFENQACDHRLRMGVATKCRAQTVVAEGHFDTIERDLSPQLDAEKWFQKPGSTNHQRRFVVVEDDSGDGGTSSSRMNSNKGVAVINRGLPEYEANSTESGINILVTLVRAVGWLSRQDLESRPESAGPCIPTPEAQCKGQHELELALYAFSGRWHESELFAEADRVNAPPVSFITSGATPQLSLLSLESPLVLSSVKRAENRESIVIRAWNPTPQLVSRSLRLPFAITELYSVRFDESRENRLDASGDTIVLSVGPRSVRTLEIVIPDNLSMFGGRIEI